MTSLPPKTLMIASAWFVFLGFWVAANFMWRSPAPKKRADNWVSFLSSVVLLTLASEYLASNYLLASFELPRALDPLANVIGLALLVSGLFLSVWARAVLGRFWSASAALAEDQPIIEEGPYVVVRHPIYAGVMGMLWGGVLLERFGFVLLTAILGTVFLIWKSRIEEALLENRMEMEYAAYKGKAWWILP